MRISGIKDAYMVINDHSGERKFMIRSDIPRVGDTIIDTDLYYEIKEVVWNYDDNTIFVYAKRPEKDYGKY